MQEARIEKQKSNNELKNKNDNINLNNIQIEIPESIIELEKYKNENILLKNEIYKLKTEKNKIQNDLKEANKIITNFQKLFQNQNIYINDLKNLLFEIDVKENEINRMKMEIEDEKNYFNDEITINFTSFDNKINNYQISCLKTNIFNEIEDRLYQKYKEFRETNNNFFVNGKIILRFKNMDENGIKNGDSIILMKNE